MSVIAAGNVISRFSVAAITIVGFLLIIGPTERFQQITNYLFQIIAASCLLLAGHAFRIQRTRILLNSAGVKSTFTEHIAPLSLGLALNTFVPLKLGELLRAALISRKLSISKTYSLVVVLFERLIDVIIVSFAFLASLLITQNGEVNNWLTLSISTVLLSTGALAILVLVIRENKFVFKLIARISKVFNKTYEFKIKHSTYSIIHGFQVFLLSRNDKWTYLLNVLASWFFYVFATGYLALAILGINVSISEAVAPLIISGNVAATPGPIDFAKDLTRFIQATSTASLGQLQLERFALAAWLTLQGAVVLVALCSLIFKSSLGLSASAKRTSPAKIDRSSAQPRNLSNFIELYFERQELARNFHLEDVRGEAQILGFFKGGSAAITALISKSGQLRVRKSVEVLNQEKLQGQYDWLLRNSLKPFVVKVLDQKTTSNRYSIDIEFNSRTTSYFEYIHNQPVENSIRILKKIFDDLDSEIWSFEFSPPPLKPNSFRNYLETQFFKRIENAFNSNEILSKISTFESILINGTRYPNLYQLTDKILKNKKLLEVISIHRPNSQMHGDLTVDNVLIDLDSLSEVLIDPSDDNEFRSTVLEFARMHQSFAGGYEFLNSQEEEPELGFDPTTSTVEITYPDLNSHIYKILDDNLLNIAKDRLSPNEYNSLDFHTGILFARMLDHRVKIDPRTAPIYYAKAVTFLGKFYETKK